MISIKATVNRDPNFPFQDKNKWGYDFQQMISDFSADIPSEKLTIIFGMYGYDWTPQRAGNAAKEGRGGDGKSNK